MKRAPLKEGICKQRELRPLEGKQSREKEEPLEESQAKPQGNRRGNDSMDLHVDALFPCHGSFLGYFRGKGAPSRHSSSFTTCPDPVLQTSTGKRQIPAGIFGGCEKAQGTGTKCRVRLLGCAEGEMSVPAGGTHSPGSQTQP